MTVKELIQKLSIMPQDYIVVHISDNDIGCHYEQEVLFVEESNGKVYLDKNI